MGLGAMAPTGIFWRQAKSEIAQMATCRPIWQHWAETEPSCRLFVLPCHSLSQPPVSAHQEDSTGSIEIKDIEEKCDPVCAISPRLPKIRSKITPPYKAQKKELWSFGFWAGLNGAFLASIWTLFFYLLWFLYVFSKKFPY